MLEKLHETMGYGLSSRRSVPSNGTDIDGHYYTYVVCVKRKGALFLRRKTFFHRLKFLFIDSIDPLT